MVEGRGTKLEIGEVCVYYVQYQTSQGRWVTRNTAFSTLGGAYQEVGVLHNNMGCVTRIVRQTTRNEVM